MKQLLSVLLFSIFLIKAYGQTDCHSSKVDSINNVFKRNGVQLKNKADSGFVKYLELIVYCDKDTTVMTLVSYVNRSTTIRFNIKYVSELQYIEKADSFILCSSRYFSIIKNVEVSTIKKSKWPKAEKKEQINLYAYMNKPTDKINRK